MRARGPVAWAGAVVFFAEALGVAVLSWFLGVVADRQEMSLANLDAGAMSVSVGIGGLVLGSCFAPCGPVALPVAVRDRRPASAGPC